MKAKSGPRQAKDGQAKDGRPAAGPRVVEEAVRKLPGRSPVLPGAEVVELVVAIGQLSGRLTTIFHHLAAIESRLGPLVGLLKPGADGKVGGKLPEELARSSEGIMAEARRAAVECWEVAGRFEERAKEMRAAEAAFWAKRGLVLPTASDVDEVGGVPAPVREPGIEEE